MQKPQLVSIRRARWRVVETADYDVCRLLTVTAAAPHADLGRRHFLTPFDEVTPIAHTRRPRRATGTRWRAALRAWVADISPPGALRSVRAAGIDVMPHQLEPALALVRGLGSRALLADEVGLGKTIEAGIVVSELLARSAVERVLVLTPAGLRDQWANELSTRFAIDARVADAAAMRRLMATLPPGVNPWTTEHLAIASIDYVKRTEVLPAVAAVPWDLVIVDEAHGIAGDSDRRAAAHAVASRAGYVLLLTATPHSGDDRSFVSLCRIGALNADDVLLVFRRRRADVRGGTKRRIHTLTVRPTAAERHMHALLDKFVAEIRREKPDAWLAASVLHKRALSSAWSLGESIQRRLDTLDADADFEGAEQLGLPLGDPDGERTSADAAPAWPAGAALADPTRELQMLRRLLTAARAAATRESKLLALDRLLRRTGARAIVFTEYRDTLLHVADAIRRAAAVLHGGMTRAERASAISDFTAGRRRLLLATDAAGEGLNLQETCRIVINLELPWNPMRLEQRIGRVDRIGQPATVHAFHLVAGCTGEPRILRRLRHRVARARASIGAPDPVGAEEERAIARLLVTGQDEDVPAAVTEPPVSCIHTPDLHAAAETEARRLAGARSIATHRSNGALQDLEVSAPWITRTRPRLRATLGGRFLSLWQVGVEDESGRLVESGIVPVTAGTLLQVLEPAMVTAIQEAARSWQRNAEESAVAFIEARLSRERKILETCQPPAPTRYQPGLFDRRAERARVAAFLSRSASEADRIARIASIERGCVLHAAEPRLLFVITP